MDGSLEDGYVLSDNIGITEHVKAICLIHRHSFQTEPKFVINNFSRLHQNLIIIHDYRRCGMRYFHPHLLA